MSRDRTSLRLFFLLVVGGCGARTGLRGDDTGDAAVAPGHCATDLSYVPSSPVTSDVVQVSVGVGHACARFADGTVRCWGNNCRGQLGDGTRRSRARPDVVIGLPPATDLALGGMLSCAATAGGDAYCWGGDVQTYLASGTGDATRPVRVPVVSNVVEVSAHSGHACARGRDASVWCWGSDLDGTAEEATETVHVRVDTPTLWAHGTALWVGSYASCVLAQGLMCWGHDDGSQYGLGPGTTTARSHVMPVATAFGAADSVAEDLDALCVVSGGVARCFGSNIGSFGLGTLEPSWVPVLVGMDAVAVTVGDQFTCLQSTSGAVACAGRNDLGQLGRGTPLGTPADPPASTRAPALLPGAATQLASQGDSSCAVVPPTAYCWGYNASGQLGDGTVAPRSTPVRVAF